jgi:hypothetical protein
MNLTTEILIIVSQTTFFVLLFLMLKRELIDKREMMSTREKLCENLLQILAIYFAIICLVVLIMLPLEGYDYGKIVVLLSLGLIIAISAYNFRVVSNNHTLPMSIVPPIIKISTQTNSGTLNF